MSTGFEIIQADNKVVIGTLWNQFYRTDYTNGHQNGYLWRFIKNNNEFDSKEFLSFIKKYNKADADSGELGGIAKHEVLRLAYEYVEHKHRFPNCYRDDQVWNDAVHAISETEDIS